MQNYRDPPPYPGHSKQVFANQPGFRQSFSGSETSTDVSLSSTENLATSQRQEPQGEENQSPFYHHPHQYYQHHQQQHHQLDYGGSGDCGSSYSILARLGMPPGGLEPTGGGGGSSKAFSVPSPSSSSPKSQHQHGLLQQQQHQQLFNNRSHLVTTSSTSSSSSGDYRYQHQHQQQQQQQQQQHIYSASQQHQHQSLISSSQSVMTTGDPLYSQGHLTVPQWNLKTSAPSSSSLANHSVSSSSSSSSSSYSSSSQSLLQSTNALTKRISGFSSNSNNNIYSSTNTILANTGQGDSNNKSFSPAPSLSHMSSFSSSSISSSSSTLSSRTRGTSLTATTTTTSSFNPGGGGGYTGRMADYASNPCPSHPYMSPRVPPVSTYHHPHPYVNAHFSLGSDDSTTSSNTTSSNPNLVSSSNVNNRNNNNLQNQHLLHQPSSSSSSSPPSSTTTTGQDSLSSYSSHLPPPPVYPGGKTLTLTPRLTPGAPAYECHLSTNEKVSGDIRTCRSYETMDKMDKLMDATLIQPDVRLCASSPGIYVPDPKLHGRSPVRSANTSSDDSDQQVITQASVAAKASRMVDMLTDENRTLREELAAVTVKVSRLLKFELEVHKMHEAHESLLQSHQKREALWLAMRRKLEERIRALELSGEGEGKIEGETGHKSSISLSEMELRNRLFEKESVIARLVAQNQELISNHKQLEAENMQLNVSLAEGKAHVGIVEKALVNAQAKVLMLDEEYQKKEHLHQATLASLQAEEEKRGEDEKIATNVDEFSPKWKKLMLEKDAHILQLENDITCLKQTYVTETSLRMEESSQPLKEVRLASLEKSSSDMEKMIDEAKTEKLKHMEELHESNKKQAELEAKVKQLQNQLVEKEAMVKVFQRSPFSILPRSSSLHALCHSPRHSPRPSLIASQALEGSGGAIGGGGTHREFSSIRHMKTGSTSAIDLGRKLSIEEDLLAKVQNLNCESKDESEEEVKLWHV